MNRGTVAGLPTPYPIVRTLPAVYQEDEFTGRFTAGLDDVLAATIATLDNIDAYLDPALAPEDFLAWLAGWTGLALDEDWPVELRRPLVARAVTNHRGRGTAATLRTQLELVTGGRVEIHDQGGVTVSGTPGTPFPAVDEPRVTVRIFVPEPDAARLELLDGLVAANKPAHLAHSVEVHQS